MDFISKYRKGSTFFFQFELEQSFKRSQIISQYKTANCSHSNKSVLQYDKKRILVVDDEEFCQTTIRVLLRKAKVALSHVDFCIDGLEAFNRVKDVYSKGDKYDLIMTDFNMPKLNGIEAT